jgi:hypothetical protein
MTLSDADFTTENTEITESREVARDGENSNGHARHALSPSGTLL